LERKRGTEGDESDDDFLSKSKKEIDGNGVIKRRAPARKSRGKLGPGPGSATVKHKSTAEKMRKKNVGERKEKKRLLKQRKVFFKSETVKRRSVRFRGSVMTHKG